MRRVIKWFLLLVGEGVVGIFFRVVLCVSFLIFLGGVCLCIDFIVKKIEVLRVEVICLGDGEKVWI